MAKDKFELLMISAGFEHGGNVTHRFLDGHPELYVYPFESQIGNRYANDYLSSLERPQYRYPEFPAARSAQELYELFYDEELKTLLRKPNGSKFKDADLKMKEEARIESFVRHLEGKPYTRANLVEAFFRSTFDAWENYQLSGENRVYVGYSPIIGIDADKILADFPAAHILHVVRNPYSAYADTKKRPFPLPLTQYIISWNLYHHILLIHQQKFPQNITIMRYEDLVADPEKTLSTICKRANLKFSDKILYPSWNGKDISQGIYPWGTVNKATTEENMATMNRLSKAEIDQIRTYSKLMLEKFDYSSL